MDLGEVYDQDPRNQFNKFRDLKYHPISGEPGYYQRNLYDKNPFTKYKYELIDGHHTMTPVDWSKK